MLFEIFLSVVSGAGALTLGPHVVTKVKGTMKSFRLRHPVIPDCNEVLAGVIAQRILMNPEKLDKHLRVYQDDKVRVTYRVGTTDSTLFMEVSVSVLGKPVPHDFKTSSTLTSAILKARDLNRERAREEDKKEKQLAAVDALESLLLSPTTGDGEPFTR